MSESLSFFVDGLPVPQGSKTAARNRSTGKLFVYDSNPSLAMWRSIVQRTARDWWTIEQDRDCIHERPFGVEMTFVMPRVKSHYGTGKNADALKTTAPKYPTVAPDLDKLVRAILDSLTSVVWADDAQVVAIKTQKVYVEDIRWRHQGVAITIHPLSNERDAL